MGDDADLEIDQQEAALQDEDDRPDGLPPLAAKWTQTGMPAEARAQLEAALDRMTDDRPAPLLPVPGPELAVLLDQLELYRQMWAELSAKHVARTSRRNAGCVACGQVYPCSTARILNREDVDRPLGRGDWVTLLLPADVVDLRVRGHLGVRVTLPGRADPVVWDLSLMPAGTVRRVPGQGTREPRT